MIETSAPVRSQRPSVAAPALAVRRKPAAGQHAVSSRGPGVGRQEPLEIRVAATDEEREAVYRSRYGVYVEELGRYHTAADHDRRRLTDSEDEHSWIVYASDGRDVVGSLRVTWGGHGFSARQIARYQLAAARCHRTSRASFAAASRPPPLDPYIHGGLQP